MSWTKFLPNGCVLSYAEYGAPDGDPILVQHGLIASIKGKGLFSNLIERGARLICLARPGYGDTSPWALTRIADWADLIAPLLDELHLARFDVLGISSGAPYGYAIAHRYPDRVGSLFVLSGTPALYDDAVRALWPYPIDLAADVPAMQSVAHALFFAHLTPRELESDDVRDSMRNGGFGVAQDLAIRCRPWGFRLDEIVTPTVLRHSRADDSVPFVTAELTARMLPRCRFEPREGEPHFSQAVLDDFIATAVRPKS